MESAVELKVIQGKGYNKEIRVSSFLDFKSQAPIALELMHNSIIYSSIILSSHLRIYQAISIFSHLLIFFSFSLHQT